VLTTLLLYLEVNKLSLTLEFVKVISGRLTITQIRDDWTGDEAGCVVDIKDIPTLTELDLICQRGSNELKIHLQSTRKRLVCIEFVWDIPLTE
jgi:hypothetical protein